MTVIVLYSASISSSDIHIQQLRRRKRIKIKQQQQQKTLTEYPNVCVKPNGNQQQAMHSTIANIPNNLMFLRMVIQFSERQHKKQTYDLLCVCYLNQTQTEEEENTDQRTLSSIIFDFVLFEVYHFRFLVFSKLFVTFIFV